MATPQQKAERDVRQHNTPNAKYATHQENRDYWAEVHRLQQQAQQRQQQQALDQQRRQQQEQDSKR
jgi:hypothetical protein